MSVAPLLEVDGLEVDLEIPGAAPASAVAIPHLSVQAGEVLGLVGESGSGKSLTLRAILGLLPPAARVRRGSIRVAGTEIVGLPEGRLRGMRGKQVAMVFQEPTTALNPTMRVGDQVAEGLRVRGGGSRRAAQARTLELLERVGIPDPSRRARQYPHELSGGLRQRVVIAIALSLEPTLLLCDEPTTALDATIQKQVLELLLALVRDLQLGLVLVTHDFGVVAATCDRTAVLYAGALVEHGPTRQVIRAPRHPYTLALLRSVPGTAGDVDGLEGIPGMPPVPGRRPGGCPFHPRCRYAIARCAEGTVPLRDLSHERASACLLVPAETCSANGSAR